MEVTAASTASLSVLEISATDYPSHRALLHNYGRLVVLLTVTTKIAVCVFAVMQKLGMKALQKGKVNLSSPVLHVQLILSSTARPPTRETGLACPRPCSTAGPRH
jgi:hypothetical protein